MLPLSALLLASAPAFAEGPAHEPPPGVTGRVEFGVEGGELPIGPVAAVGGGVAVPLQERVSAEVDALVGFDGALSPRVAGFAGARVELGAGFSVSAGGGGGWRAGRPVPIGRLGAAFDVRLGSGIVRLSLTGEGSPAGLGANVGAGVTLPLERRAVPTARPEATEPPPSVAALPEAAEPPLAVLPPNALVWVPHPVCAWVPADEAADLLAIADPALPVQVRAPGYLPSELPRDGSRTVTLEPAPPFGAVVVVAYPGDEVSIDAAEFPLAQDGTAVFGAPEGAVRVTVVGAGRRVELEGAVAAGYALWLRAPAPTPLVVTFPPGSAVLPPEVLPQLELFADQAGDHGFRVVGSFSGEVDLGETRRLADQRAEALKDALLRAGIPGKAINVLSTATPTAGEAPAALRVARIEPILPKEAR